MWNLNFRMFVDTDEDLACAQVLFNRLHRPKVKGLLLFSFYSSTVCHIETTFFIENDK